MIETSSVTNLKAFYVRWLDAASTMDQKWREPEEVQKSLVEIHSLGFLLEVQKDFITLVLNVSNDGGVSGDITIPTVSILEMKEITLNAI